MHGLTPSWAWSAALLATSAWLPGCPDPQPTPSPSAGDAGGMLSPIALPRIRPGGGSEFVLAQIALRAGAFARTHVPLTPVFQGTLPLDGHASHAFDVQAGHCHRIVVVGGIGVEDLDVALVGPDGSEVDAERGRSREPELGSVRPLCPPTGGRYRLDVHMAAGSGPYGVRVFVTP